jgi:coniferyl-aldehyde dehydrogenase
VGAIAAGNRVMVKPSEITPRTAALIADLLAERFPGEVLAGVTGGADVAAAFAALPFDHLFFTGSTRVGKLVMQAASAGLVPVTLELGGKSPAIVHRSYDVARAAERIVAGKLVNAGQTCVAPDYVLVPHDRLDAFVAAAERAAAALYPRLVASADYTRMVTRQHWERLAGLVAGAEAAGARVRRVNPAGEACTPENRVFAPTFVLGATDAMPLMQEELFGPVLPVLGYDPGDGGVPDAALAAVAARPHPLALYYFDDDRPRVHAVLARTRSGGALVNDVLYHLGQPNLPFGGVGESGMGHYHGFDGFATFSKKKGVMVQGRLAATSLLRPPYGARQRALIARLLRLVGG